MPSLGSSVLPHIQPVCCSLDPLPSLWLFSSSWLDFCSSLQVFLLWIIHLDQPLRVTDLDPAQLTLNLHIPWLQCKYRCPLLRRYFCAASSPKDSHKGKGREEGGHKSRSVLKSTCLQMVPHGWGIFRKNISTQAGTAIISNILFLQ